MKKYSVFVHQLAADPASLHSKRTAVAKLGNFPNKVLCSEILVCPVVQELTVLEHMHGCMELEGDVEHFSVLRCSPIIQILVSIKEPFGKVLAMVKFFFCQEGTKAIEVAGEFIESLMHESIVS